MWQKVRKANLTVSKSLYFKPMFLQIKDRLEGGLVHTAETFGSCIWLCWTSVSFRVFKEIYFFYGFGVYRLHFLYFCRRHMPLICGALMKKEGSLFEVYRGRERLVGS